MNDRMIMATELESEDLRRIYDYLFELSIILNRRYDPCGFGDSNGSHCIAYGDNNTCCSKDTIYPIEGDVSRKCKYVRNDNSCGNPNLDCKRWFCRTAINNMGPEVYELFKAIEMIGKHFNLVYTPHLGEPYVGCDNH
jgi:hypothetical protein